MARGIFAKSETQAASVMRELQDALKIRLDRLDFALDKIGIHTEQRKTPIAYRVIPFSGPKEAIRGASILLNDEGFITTPVYYPTIAQGKGAIRISLSADHKIVDIDRIVIALDRLLSKKSTSAGSESTFLKADETL